MTWCSHSSGRSASGKVFLVIAGVVKKWESTGRWSSWRSFRTFHNVLSVLSYHSEERWRCSKLGKAWELFSNLHRFPEPPEWIRLTALNCMQSAWRVLQQHKPFFTYNDLVFRVGPHPVSSNINSTLSPGCLCGGSRTQSNSQSLSLYQVAKVFFSRQWRDQMDACKIMVWTRRENLENDAPKFTHLCLVQ